MQLSIIIVSYNVKYFLEQCLCSVQKAIRHMDAEIFVIDNASSDGSCKYLAPDFPSVIFIDNVENTGFAKANNQGLRLSRGKYVLFLNPDTILPEDCLQHCLRFMESHPLVGACGIRMLDGSGRYLPESKRGFPTLQASFFKLSGLTGIFPRSRMLAGYYLGHQSERQDQEVDVLAGAFFLAGKEVLEAAGNFDEQFFMYGEDIDLSFRIRQAGKTLQYLANPPIIHFKGESTKTHSLHYIKMFYKAMAQFVRKHNSGYKSVWFIRLIEGSIWLRASLAAAGNVFTKQASARPAGHVQTIVLGTDKDLHEVTVFLNQNADTFRQINHLKEWNELEDLVRRRQPDEIIFCEGSLSYNHIIHLMQKLPKSISFWIHSAGTHSIVCSDSKQSSGRVLA
ncbi:MAG: glycosyltransferase family 2 protein [Chitinophagaceae bacterium]